MKGVQWDCCGNSTKGKCWAAGMERIAANSRETKGQICWKRVLHTFANSTMCLLVSSSITRTHQRVWGHLSSFSPLHLWCCGVGEVGGDIRTLKSPLVSFSAVERNRNVWFLACSTFPVSASRLTGIWDLRTLSPKRISNLTKLLAVTFYEYWLNGCHSSCGLQASPLVQQALKLWAIFRKNMCNNEPFRTRAVFKTGALARIVFFFFTEKRFTVFVFDFFLVTMLHLIQRQEVTGFHAFDLSFPSSHVAFPFYFHFF